MPDPLITLSGHTEGPWHVSPHVSYRVDADPDGTIGPNVVATMCDQHTVGQANARLIAAAPDLLAIATELACKLAMAGQPAQAFESFASRGIKPPAFVMREALGYDEPPQPIEGESEHA